jgi:hypothetical protein
VSSRGLLGDLIREAHGKSVAGPSPEPGPFPLGRLQEFDPEVYLATSDSGRTLTVRHHLDERCARTGNRPDARRDRADPAPGCLRLTS